jgi:hypothetical protein
MLGDDRTDGGGRPTHETVLFNSSKSPDPIAIRVPLQPLNLALKLKFRNSRRQSRRG